jgi:hypothetical protein
VPGLVPGIHALFVDRKQDVDGRDKPGHDAVRGYRGFLISAAELIVACRLRAYSMAPATGMSGPVRTYSLAARTSQTKRPGFRPAVRFRVCR